MFLFWACSEDFNKHFSLSLSLSFFFSSCILILLFCFFSLFFFLFLYLSFSFLPLYLFISIFLSFLFSFSLLALFSLFSVNPWDMLVVNVIIRSDKSIDSRTCLDDASIVRSPVVSNRRLIRRREATCWCSRAAKIAAGDNERIVVRAYADLQRLVRGLSPALAGSVIRDGLVRPPRDARGE